MEVFYHFDYTPQKQFLYITIRFSKQKATFELKIFTLLRVQICQRMILLYPMTDKKLIYSDPQNYNELLILMRTQCTAWHTQGTLLFLSSQLNPPLYQTLGQELCMILSVQFNNRFQVYNSIRHLYMPLYVHQPKSNLLSSLYI